MSKFSAFSRSIRFRWALILAIVAILVGLLGASVAHPARAALALDAKLTYHGPEPVSVAVGGTSQLLTVQYTNTGLNTWPSTAGLFVRNVGYEGSDFQCPSWISRTRVANVPDFPVYPGEGVTITFYICGNSLPAHDYVLGFQLGEKDQGEWLGDPNQNAQFNVTVLATGKPTLNTISNSDGDEAYNVSWTTASGAIGYELQEDSTSSFSSPTLAYDGSSTSWAVTGQVVGTYYYRVRGCNASAECGLWSNTRSVVVQPTPTTPALTLTRTDTPMPALTPTPTDTDTPVLTLTRTDTSTPALTPTPTYTDTPTLTPTRTYTSTPAIANDDFDNATKIISLPYTITEDISSATTAADDPIFTCSNGQKFKTVWFAYNPTKNGVLTVDTLGSGFDTVLAVWTGTRGNLALAACSDDALGFTQSQVQLSVTSGQSYYIEAASYDSSPSNPSLKLNASLTIPITATNTRTPTSIPAPTTATFISTAAQDGWVLESSETSNVGGSINTTGNIYLGDDAAKKQYRGILSFSTGSLPDTAVITKVTLKVRQQAILGGGNPVSIFQGFMFDVKNGFFGAATLQIGDFQTAASASYGPSAPAPVGGWYSFNLTNAKSFVNKLATGSGLTQIRLRFKLDDNNNAIANYLSLYSGNAPAGNQPQLVITYYVP